MAWFHQAQPPLTESSKPSKLEDLPHTQLSALDTSSLVDRATPSPVLQFPSGSQDSVPLSLEDLSCMCAGVGARTDPVPLSYATLQEQRCVLSWFQGWTAAQQERFLEDLVAKAVPGKVCSLLEQLSTLQVKDRVPSIFECQLRLWTQWFESWTEEERNVFLSSLEDRDSIFVAHFYHCVAGTAGRA